MMKSKFEWVFDPETSFRQGGNYCKQIAIDDPAEVEAMAAGRARSRAKALAALNDHIAAVEAGGGSWEYVWSAVGSTDGIAVTLPDGARYAINAAGSRQYPDGSRQFADGSSMDHKGNWIVRPA